MTKPTSYIAALLFVFTLISFPSEAFLTCPGTPSPRRQATSSLKIGNLFGGLFGAGEEKQSNNGSNTILDMPGNIKVGPLKFFMQIYLVGQQNTPSESSWALNNNDENESIDMYYKDGTGMFSLGIKENGVSINRYGMRPSLEYMLQESVMLHGLLDELQEVAEVEEVEQEKRLIQFKESDAVSKARGTLPARKA
jgi:hypothetical protein